jgi:hypothetical protein
MGRPLSGRDIPAKGCAVFCLICDATRSVPILPCPQIAGVLHEDGRQILSKMQIFSAISGIYRKKRQKMRQKAVSFCAEVY